MDLNIIIPAVVGSAVTALGFYLNYRIKLKQLRVENKALADQSKSDNLRLEYFNKVVDFESISAIKEAVDNIFANTRADRFLILIAMNGKTNFNVVSVIFEQHKNTKYSMNAIAKYRNLSVDDNYRQMLKMSESIGVVRLKTDDMKPQILKDIYELEGVKYSKVRHLLRKPLDDGNDFIVYSSLATHSEEDFTNKERVIIKSAYEGVIKPKIEEVISN